MEYFELADTALKIGLGALIAGAFTLIASRTKHRQELELGRRNRREKLLEKVAEEFEKTYQLLSSKYENLLGLCRAVSGEKYRINAHEIIHSSSDISRIHVIESKLLLLGLKQEALLIMAFRKISGDFEKLALPRDKTHPDPYALNSKLEDFFECRGNVYEKLSEYYDDPGKRS